MFKSDLFLKATVPGKWQLSKPLIWQGSLGVFVPVGFETDLASLPPFVRPFIDRNGKTRRPAIIHDYLYQTAIHTGVSRKNADLTFLDAMKFEGVGLTKRALIYRAVRMFGWMFYQSKS